MTTLPFSAFGSPRSNVALPLSSSVFSFFSLTGLILLCTEMSSSARTAGSICEMCLNLSDDERVSKRFGP